MLIQRVWATQDYWQKTNTERASLFQLQNQSSHNGQYVLPCMSSSASLKMSGTVHSIMPHSSPCIILENDSAFCLPLTPLKFKAHSQIMLLKC